MSEKQGPLTGEFVWHDIFTTNPAESQEFFTNLFVWNTTDQEIAGFGYTSFGVGESRIGGFMPLDPSLNIPSHILSYVHVPDVDQVVELTKELGGTVMMEPTSMPGVGRFAVIGDPLGAVISPFTFEDPNFYAPTPQGPGNFCWFELATSDIQAAKDFYTKIFGWNFKDMPGEWGAYSIFKVGDVDTAGMWRIPETETFPPHWLAYFWVDDVDGMTEKARDLGATILKEPQDIPGMGRFSVMADPTGAAFGIYTSI